MAMHDADSIIYPQSGFGDGLIALGIFVLSTTLLVSCHHFSLDNIIGGHDGIGMHGSINPVGIFICGSY
jgi:hypothetical protein